MNQVRNVFISSFRSWWRRHLLAIIYHRFTFHHVILLKMHIVESCVIFLESWNQLRSFDWTSDRPSHRAINGESLLPSHNLFFQYQENFWSYCRTQFLLRNITNLKFIKVIYYKLWWKPWNVDRTSQTVQKQILKVFVAAGFSPSESGL